MRLASIGRSYEDRDVWLLTVTNAATGADADRPAFWVDGNIHANEVSGSSACLYLLHQLCSGYGRSEDVTRCLDTRVFYVCPRVGPDGAELFLADNPRFIRSSTRPYPTEDVDAEGLMREDMDGDGRILTMRVPDPNGHWKACPEEPRLLVERDPAEAGGRYFRLLWEGRIRDFDGFIIKGERHRENLDLNRNFPSGWRQEHEQAGAGDFPASEPEVRAVVEFVAAHPNIIGSLSFHTWGGVLLRPHADRGDEAFPEPDLRAYEKIGRKGGELTGYTVASSHEYFGGYPREWKLRAGRFKEWMYDEQGRFGWTAELWSPYRRAGIESMDHATWFPDHPLEDELKLLRWSDEALGGRGYVDWYPFDHPEIGRVEIGGWDWPRFVSNPPPEFLEEEIAPFAGWLVWHLLISPRLEVYNAGAEPLGSDVYRVRLVVHNTGWLPTHVTEKALEKKLVRGVICEIALPEGAALVNGESRRELGQLAGRARKPTFLGTSMGLDTTEDRARCEWVVRAPGGGVVTLSARHERAGRVAAGVRLVGPVRHAEPRVPGHDHQPPPGG